MELLGDVGHVESRLVRLETMVLLGDKAQLEARFGHWDILLILMQDMFTVCVKCTIGSEIILDAPESTPRRRGSSGSSIWSVWR